MPRSKLMEFKHTEKKNTTDWIENPISLYLVTKYEPLSALLRVIIFFWGAPKIDVQSFKQRSWDDISEI